MQFNRRIKLAAKIQNAKGNAFLKVEDNKPHDGITWQENGVVVSDGKVEFDITNRTLSDLTLKFYIENNDVTSNCLEINFYKEAPTELVITGYNEPSDPYDWVEGQDVTIDAPTVTTNLGGPVDDAKFTAPSGDLPSGLKLEESTGVIKGTVGEIGDKNQGSVIVTATSEDNGGIRGSVTITWSVATPLIIDNTIGSCFLEASDPIYVSANESDKMDTHNKLLDLQAYATSKNYKGEWFTINGTIDFGFLINFDQNVTLVGNSGSLVDITNQTVNSFGVIVGSTTKPAGDKDKYTGKMDIRSSTTFTISSSFAYGLYLNSTAAVSIEVNGIFTIVSSSPPPSSSSFATGMHFGSIPTGLKSFGAQNKFVLIGSSAVYSCNKNLGDLGNRMDVYGNKATDSAPGTPSDYAKYHPDAQIYLVTENTTGGNWSKLKYQVSTNPSVYFFMYFANTSSPDKDPSTQDQMKSALENYIVQSYAPSVGTAWIQEILKAFNS